SNQTREVRTGRVLVGKVTNIYTTPIRKTNKHPHSGIYLKQTESAVKRVSLEFSAEYSAVFNLSQQQPQRIPRSGNRIKVDFVDPEAPEIHWKDREKQVARQQEKAEDLAITRIALDAVGELAEMEVLQATFAGIEKAMADIGWEAAKEKAMAAMGEPGFWELEDRWKTLNDIEYRDRFEAAMESCASLLSRLEETRKTRITFAPDLVKRLANKILLLQRSLDAFEQDIPQDAFVKVSIEEATPETADFMGRLLHMYTSWAKRRRMKCHLEREEEQAYLHVSGFAAYPILIQEHGLHVWEDGSKPPRTRVKVMVCAQPEEPSNASDEVRVREAFSTEQPGTLKIVRKYRKLPTASVRDFVRGWKTGKLHRVLDGYFDVL
ncbi:MAG: PCRF domain-containing protein, partial [Bacteroidota bacterium]